MVKYYSERGLKFFLRTKCLDFNGHGKEKERGLELPSGEPIKTLEDNECSMYLVTLERGRAENMKMKEIIHKNAEKKAEDDF